MESESEYLSSRLIIYTFILSSVGFPNIICCAPSVDDGGWEDPKLCCMV